MSEQTRVEFAANLDEKMRRLFLALYENANQVVAYDVLIKATGTATHGSLHILKFRLVEMLECWNIPAKIKTKHKTGYRLVMQATTGVHSL